MQITGEYDLSKCVEEARNKINDLERYEKKVAKLPVWYKNWLMANEEHNLKTRPPEFIF